MTEFWTIRRKQKYLWDFKKGTFKGLTQLRKTTFCPQLQRVSENGSHVLNIVVQNDKSTPGPWCRCSIILSALPLCRGIFLLWLKKYVTGDLSS